MKKPKTPPSKRKSGSPSVPEMLQQALVLHQKGQLIQAQALYEAILKVQPTQVDTLYLLGAMALQKDHFREAIDFINQAIAVLPDRALLYFTRGNAEQGCCQWDASVVSYNQAIALQPHYAEAYASRGRSLQMLRQLEAALIDYKKAIALKPDYTDAYLNCGAVFQELDQKEEAMVCYDQVIELNPNRADVYSNRGLLLQELDEPQAALASYNRALALSPNCVDAYCNRGLLLQELKEWEAAQADYEKAIALKPDYAEAYSNRGNLLHELRQWEASLASYDEAIRLKPEFAPSYFNKAMVLLLMGDFEHGWPLYEWRWKQKELSRFFRAFPKPMWLGAESLKNKTILLRAEQGFGDTLQFCRYVPLVAALGARVILEVPEALMDLMKTLEGVSEWVGKGSPVPEMDFYSYLCSLPLAFKTNFATIPHFPFYLRSDERKRLFWKKQLGVSTQKRIGLVWSGKGFGKRSDHHRSIVLSEFLSHLPEGFDYISLQKEVQAIDQETLLASKKLRHFGALLQDFSDTAALCDLMDLVISIDTSVVHLSGALGKPTYLLLPYVSDWRWFLDRSDSPWYPSMTIFRQERGLDWTPVFASVLEKMRAFFTE